jgi:hypothetical protein
MYIPLLPVHGVSVGGLTDPDRHLEIIIDENDAIVVS